MLAFKISLVYLITSVVQSAPASNEKAFKNIDGDLKNVTFDRSQCKDRICIYKCCGENEVLTRKRCMPASKFRILKHKVKYVDIPIVQSINGSVVTRSSKRLTKDLVLIPNPTFPRGFIKRMDVNDSHIYEVSL